MAQETKVGLLAGLAFIICFAVILTNRGRDQIVPEQMAAPNGNPTVNQQPVDTPKQRTTIANTRDWNHDQTRNNAPANNRTPNETQVAHNTTPNQNRQGQARIGQPRQGQARQRQARTNPQQNHPSLQGSRPQQNSSPQQLAKSNTPPSSVKNATTRSRTNQPKQRTRTQSAKRRTPQQQKVANNSGRSELERKLDELSRKIDDDKQTENINYRGNQQAPNQTTVANNRRPKQQPTNRMSRPTTLTGRQNTPRRSQASSSQPQESQYTIAKGDNLHKIARKFYGDTSQRVIKAIFEANRDTLPTANDLKVGQDIVLPAIANTGQPNTGQPDTGQPDTGQPNTGQRNREPRGTVTARQTRQRENTTQRANTTPGDFTWYQIKPNDGYIKIAREQLGDQSRWKEIFELNKDKFPDPGKIRVGVRIKLPSSKIADARR